MTVVGSREEYFETGLGVLEEIGYAGFKLAEVCDRLGVTTGSFYHRFSNWPDFTHELARYWVEQYPNRWAATLRAETDPRRRLAMLAERVKTMPHRTEVAIRTWAAVDPEVHTILSHVDQQRFDLVCETVLGILHDPNRARMFASWSTYLRIGYQQALIPQDTAALDWAVDRFVDAVYSGPEPPAAAPGA